MVRAVWDAIYESIRGRIEDGTYAYGELLPSESMLVEEFSCSHNTLRKALAVLAREGMVLPIHGKGVRVIHRPVRRALFSLGGIESFKETAQRNGLEASTRVVEFERVVADETTSDLTGFPTGVGLFRVVRVRSIGGEALILDKNLFLASVMPDLTPQVCEGSIYEYLEDTLGLGIVTSKRAITVERVTPEDEELLDMGDDKGIAVVTSQSFDRAGEMVEFTQSRHRPDHFVFHDVAVRGA